MLAAESSQHSEEDEVAAAEEEEVDSDEEEAAKLPHDAPQNRCSALFAIRSAISNRFSDLGGALLELRRLILPAFLSLKN